MDWITVLVLLVGIIVQPILYELSPLPDIIERIKARKKKKNWWDPLFNGSRKRP